LKANLAQQNMTSALITLKINPWRPRGKAEIGIFCRTAQSWLN